MACYFLQLLPDLVPNQHFWLDLPERNWILMRWSFRLWTRWSSIQGTRYSCLPTLLVLTRHVWWYRYPFLRLKQSRFLDFPCVSSHCKVWHFIWLQCAVHFALVNVPNSLCGDGLRMCSVFGETLQCHVTLICFNERTITDDHVYLCFSDCSIACTRFTT